MPALPLVFMDIVNQPFGNLLLNKNYYEIDDIVDY